MLLIGMCGLPASVKSALAEALGRALPGPVLSVDRIETALWRAGIEREQPTGLAAYAVAHTLAAENLRLGLTVVVDAVNDADEARAAWVDLARQQAVPLRFVEVTCPDVDLHRRRLLETASRPGRLRRADVGVGAQAPERLHHLGAGAACARLAPAPWLTSPSRC